MIKDQLQKQDSGDGSSQYQANNDLIINQGLSYSDVREIAMDVFEANFFKLSGQAQELVDERANSITDTLLKKLLRVSNEFQFSADPDFQYSVYLVQREFARTGNEELGDLLTDILVERSKNTERDILQIVLNESLLVAPKLTITQINTLSLIQVLSNMRFGSLESFDDLEQTFINVISVIGKLEELTESNLLHLQYSGSLSINHIVKKDVSRKIFETYKYISDDINHDNFIKIISDKCPSLSTCINIFNKKRMYRSELTSVGMLIGLANLKKIFPDIDYKVWIK